MLVIKNQKRNKSFILYFLLFTFYFLLFSHLLLSQNKYKITFVENQDSTFSFNPKKYNSTFFDSLSVYTELNKLTEIERNKGFLSANFDSLIFDSIYAKAYFYRGKKLYFRELYFSEETENLVKKLGFKQKKWASVFSENKLISLQEKIISHYENIGFPFAYAEITDYSFQNDSISAFLKIKKNNFICFDSLIVHSKVKISQRYLQEYLSVKKGEVYSEKDFRAIENKIRDLNFISLKRPPEVEFSKNKADVYLFLQKKKANNFSGIIGILPPENEDEKLLISGDVNLFLQNVFHHGEYLSFKWQKYDAFSQKMLAEFEYPYIFNIPFGVKTSINLQKQDTTYLNMKSNVAFQYYYKSSNYLKIFYESESSSLLQKQTDENNSLAELSVSSFGLGFYHNKLDYKQNPRSGWFLETSFSTGNKIIANDSISVQYKFQSTISIYLPLFKQMTIHLQNYSGVLQNPRLYQNELFRLGGLNSLKGFDEQTIFASSYSVFNAEVKFLFEKNSNFYLFYNQAYYEQNLEGNIISDMPLGFGVGLNFQTKAGVFSLVYALGKQNSSPINIRNAKIHFGYISRF